MLSARHPRIDDRIRAMRTPERRRVAALLLCALIVPLRFALAQRSSPVRVRDFLFAERPLTRPEVAEVVEAASEEVAGRPFSVANTLGERMEFMLDAHGHLRFARNPADRVLTEYTARVARYCDDGSLAPHEMAIEYRHEDGEWTATTRLVHPGEPGLALAALLSGETHLEDTGLTADRRARGFSSPARPPDVQTLFIDVRTTLPLRWETADVRGERHIHAIEYERSLDLWPPRGMPTPECVARP
jgi:hypothetical protein